MLSLTSANPLSQNVKNPKSNLQALCLFNSISFSFKEFFYTLTVQEHIIVSIVKSHTFINMGISFISKTKMQFQYNDFRMLFGVMTLKNF